MTEKSRGTAPVPAEALDAVARGLQAGQLRRDVPIAPYTTFRIGGPADLLYDADTGDDLADAIDRAEAAGVDWFVLGLGANILVGDGGFRGLVIRNRARHVRWDPEGHCTAESGTVMADLIRDAVAGGWSGLEHYVGIPSTVGGAIWQNLHFLSPAPERERTMFIAEVFEACRIRTATGTRTTVDAAYVGFGYDDTVFHHTRDVVLDVTFRLTRGDPDVMHRILQENLSWRGARHPWLEHHPSAGSIFKKLEGIGAGRLVDQCGLKGFRIGDAQISHMHANIMVNLGHATAADVRALITHAQSAVEARFGHRLEPEIGFIGAFTTT
ncbi:MAG: UDP-N-acetylmuramate dehydrogenase [Gemmatimonadaceae bacterium]|nr:UDP-N-acetylmuramate dehydrogenase [Gemmatimonadaceae bacterium]